MANHEKKITLTDLQQKILSNDLYNDVSDNAGIDAWLDGAINGKLNNCWKRMQQEWTTKLMNDSSFTDPIPSNQADFVALSDTSLYKSLDRIFCCKSVNVIVFV